MKNLRLFAVASLLAPMAIACASTTPPELIRARTAYRNAAQGPAATLNPADLHTAKQSLDIAERSFDEDGDSQETKDIAYAAERRAEFAAVKARTAESMKAQKAAEMREQSMKNEQHKLTAAQLSSANQALASQGQDLANERQRREDAEKRAAQANAELSKIASVKNEDRGMVITLSGSVLFASGKSELLGNAQSKLKQVSDVLTQQDKEAQIRVEGYTDSTGSSATNERLSQARAESVRGYLVSHGIASDRVTAVGLGPSNPIADNNSAEGRANNRRVEIIVQPTGASNSGSKTPSFTR